MSSLSQAVIASEARQSHRDSFNVNINVKVNIYINVNFEIAASLRSSQ